MFGWTNSGGAKKAVKLTATVSTKLSCTNSLARQTLFGWPNSSLDGSHLLVVTVENNNQNYWLYIKIYCDWWLRDWRINFRLSNCTGTAMDTVRRFCSRWIHEYNEFTILCNQIACTLHWMYMVAGFCLSEIAKLQLVIVLIHCNTD